MTQGLTSHDGSPKRTVVFFDRLSVGLLVVLTGLVPLFFLPYIGLPAELSKSYLIALVLSLLVVAWSTGRLVEGSVSFPKSPILIALCALPATFFISALFSKAPGVSFAGTTLGLGSVAMVAFLSLSFLGGMLYFGNGRRLSLAFTILAGSSVVVALYQIAYLLFGSRFLSLGTFFTNTSTLIGRFNDLGLYFGGVVIATLIVLEVISLRKIHRILLTLLLVVGLFFVALVNFPLLWGIIAAFSVILLVYSLAVLRPAGEEPRAHFPFIPFIVILISLLFLIANPIVGGILPRFFGAAEQNVRPSVEATAAVTWQSLKQNPITGIGPNRFENAWLLYHPKEVIPTDFWDTSFDTGFGLLPSFVATTGVLGTIAIIAFLLLFCIAGFLHVFRPRENKYLHALLLLSFTLALYGWIVALIYNPGVVIVFFTFLFSGAFIGLLVSEGVIHLRTVSFLDDPRKSFFSILALVAVLIITLVVVFMGAQKFAALSVYAKGTRALARGDIAETERLFTRAAALDENDYFYRSLASLRLSQIGTLINNPPTSQEVLKQNFQALFSAAEAAARNAVNYDRTNPENWVMLASVYQRVVPLQVEGAKSNAIAAYEEGRKLSPQNPGFDLLRARLEIAANNLPEAKTHIEAALAKKPNFITALLLLSQIEENQNNLSTAEDALRKAIQYAPMNSDALLAFGLYKYRRAEYQAAVPLLERTLVVNRSSATAAYFLGLSYEKVGRIEEAKKIFDILKKSFPNDTTLLKIDENLQAGKAALDGLSSSPASVAEEEKKTTEQ